MDLVEINYHDYLAECTDGPDGNINYWFCSWFTEDWENYVLSIDRPEGKKIAIDDIQFRVGDDLISLSEGVYDVEPHTAMGSQFGGRLATLAMITTTFIQNGKLKGKMRIHNASKPTIETNYELLLKSAEMKQLIGIAIRGDGWDFDNCKYKIVKSDLSFKYIDNAKEMSVFSRETDSSKSKLLKQYMLEYITKKLGPAIEDYQLSQLSIKALVSNSVGADYSLKNMLSIHNKIMRKAFKNLAEKIINIANSLLVKNSPKLQYSEFYGLVDKKNKEHNLKVYSGHIDGFDSLAFCERKNAIISNEDDLVIVHIPVEYKDLRIHIIELADGSPIDPKEQTYETSGSHIIMSLKRLSENKAEIKLVDLKILNIKPTSETPINVAVDHLITNAVVEHVRPFLEEAMTYEELQELAIKPDVDIEYDPDDDLMAEDSEYDC